MPSASSHIHVRVYVCVDYVHIDRMLSLLSCSCLFMHKEWTPSMDMQHRNGQQHRHNTQHDNGHALWTWTYSNDMDTQNGRGRGQTLD